MPSNINASRSAPPPMLSGPQVDLSPVSDPGSFDDRLTVWTSPHGYVDGFRCIAASRIRSYISDMTASRELDLGGLHLSELPPLPEGVRVLRANDNCLRSLTPLDADMQALFLDR